MRPLGPKSEPETGRADFVSRRAGVDETFMSRYKFSEPGRDSLRVLGWNSVILMILLK